MPIYEYECPAHGRYEVSQRITDAALTSCARPDCTLPVRKLISHSSFALKGSGWYLTDYGRGSGGANSTPKSDEKKSLPKAPTASSCGSAPCANGCAGAPA